MQPATFFSIIQCMSCLNLFAHYIFHVFFIRNGSILLSNNKVNVSKGEVPLIVMLQYNFILQMFLLLR